MEVKLTTDLSGVLVDAVNAICDKLGIVFDWTSENVLPIAQDLFNKFVAYRTAMSWAEVLIPLGLLILFVTLYFIADNRGNGDWAFGFVVCIVITAIVLLFCGIDGAIHLVRCYNFPELELYKWLLARGVI